jgi:hypothetical protein
VTAEERAKSDCVTYLMTSPYHGFGTHTAEELWTKLTPDEACIAAQSPTRNSES